LAVEDLTVGGGAEPQGVGHGLIAEDVAPLLEAFAGQDGGDVLVAAAEELVTARAASPA
jgi:hypothetical protein